MGRINSFIISFFQKQRKKLSNWPKIESHPCQSSKNPFFQCVANVFSKILRLVEIKIKKSKKIKDCCFDFYQFKHQNERKINKSYKTL